MSEHAALVTELTALAGRAALLFERYHSGHDPDAIPVATLVDRLVELDPRLARLVHRWVARLLEDFEELRPYGERGPSSRPTGGSVMPETHKADAAQEARVRRLARRKGLLLRKPRNYLGDYMVIDPDRNSVVVERISLDGAEAYLSDGQAAAGGA